MRIRFLGCGDSRGTPLISGSWGRCDPQNPKNNRTRPSICVEIGQETWLIDMSPDLRVQYLREGLHRVDGVLCTHCHFDHVAGLEELKVIAQQQQTLLPLYSDAKTLQALDKRCGYVFAYPDRQQEGYQPFLQPVVIDGPFTIAGIQVVPFVQDHRFSTSLGFRFPNWAYSTDVWQLDETAFATLKDLDVWIVDCLDRVPRVTHTHLEQTLLWIERLRPKKAVLTHMSCQLDYADLLAELPPHVVPAYDGLVIEV